MKTFQPLSWMIHFFWSFYLNSRSVTLSDSCNWAQEVANAIKAWYLQCFWQGLVFTSWKIIEFLADFFNFIQSFVWTPKMKVVLNLLDLFVLIQLYCPRLNPLNSFVPYCSSIPDFVLMIDPVTPVLIINLTNFIK